VFGLAGQAISSDVVQRDLKIRSLIGANGSFGDEASSNGEAKPDTALINEASEYIAPFSGTCANQIFRENILTLTSFARQLGDVRCGWKSEGLAA
jgi:hypothetical protein